MTQESQTSLLERHLRVPKYLRLAEELRAQMLAGDLRCGDRLPSFSEMRQRYGATQKTVDKVFSLLEDDGLIVRQPGRGIFMAPQARPIAQAPARPKRAQKTGLIGLSGWGFGYGESSYWTRVLSGMRSAAQRHGVELLLLEYDSSAGFNRVDGLVICECSALQSLPALPPDKPCVSLLVDMPGMTSVCADDFEGARQATAHLLSLGHRRIGFLHSHDQSVTVRRLAGFGAALAATGIDPLLRWTRALPYGRTFGERFVQAGYEQVARWLAEDWDELGLTALLAQNDETAIGALKAFQENGRRVPADVSVVGFDGLECANYISPCLTTVEVPLVELGQAAVEMLCAQIQNPAATVEHRTLPITLRPGDSTAQIP